VRFVIAAVALVILIGAIAFSKRRATPMDAGAPAAAGAVTGDGAAVHAVNEGDEPLKLAVDALDRWIMDLGDEEHALRRQLREAKSQLGGAKTPQ
jgi:hypothetical protein